MCLLYHRVILLLGRFTTIINSPHFTLSPCFLGILPSYHHTTISLQICNIATSFIFQICVSSSLQYPVLTPLMPLSEILRAPLTTALLSKIYSGEICSKQNQYLLIKVFTFTKFPYVILWLIFFFLNNRIVPT